MSKMIVGSKVLSGWFDTDKPEEWEINSLLDAMQKSIMANVLKQTEVSMEEAKEFQQLNEPLIWAYRELLSLKNEMLAMQKGGAA